MFFFPDFSASLYPFWDCEIGWGEDLQICACTSKFGNLKGPSSYVWHGQIGCISRSLRGDGQRSRRFDTLVENCPNSVEELNQTTGQIFKLVSEKLRMNLGPNLDIHIGPLISHECDLEKRTGSFLDFHPEFEWRQKRYTWYDINTDTNIYIEIKKMYDSFEGPDGTGW